MTARTCPARGRALVERGASGWVLTTCGAKFTNFETSKPAAGQLHAGPAEILHHAGVCPPGAAEHVPW